MKKMMKFLKDESGATAIEYGLLAALISIIALAAMTTAGENLNTVFESVRDALVIGGAP